MNLVFLDIETAPIGWQQCRDAGLQVPGEVVAAHAAAASTAKPPKNYSKPESIERWRQAQYAKSATNARAAWGKGSLDSKHGELVCAGVAYNWDEPIVLWGESERDTLRQLQAFLSQFPDAAIVSHGGRRFDWPFLWERATGYGLPGLACRVYEAPYGVRRMLRTDDPRLLDTRELWNTTGPSSEALLKICAAFNICQGGEDKIHGGLVLDALLSGADDLVKVHAYWDIMRLQALWYNHLAPSLWGPEYTHRRTT